MIHYICTLYPAYTPEHVARAADFAFLMRHLNILALGGSLTPPAGASDALGLGGGGGGAGSRRKAVGDDDGLWADW